MAAILRRLDHVSAVKVVGKWKLLYEPITIFGAIFYFLKERTNPQKGLFKWHARARITLLLL